LLVTMPGDSSSQTLLEAKLLAIVCCVVSALLGCFIARILEQGRSAGTGSSVHDFSLVFGNAMAAGILLSASQVHMLPDSAKVFLKFSDLPIASMIAGAAFVFLVVLGEVVGSWCSDEEALSMDGSVMCCVDLEESGARRADSSRLDGEGDRRMPPFDESAAPMILPGWAYRKMMAEQLDKSSSENGELSNRKNFPLKGVPGYRRAKMRNWLHLSHKTGDSRRARASLVSKGGSGSSTVSRMWRSFGLHSTRPGSLNESLLQHGATCCQQPTAETMPPKPLPCADSGACCAPPCRDECSEANVSTCYSRGECAPEFPTKGRAANFSRSCSDQRRDAHHGHSHDMQFGQVAASGGGGAVRLKSLMLFFALGFHSVTEGLGLGSAQNASLLLTVVVAVLAHKGLAAFALGSAMMHAGMSAKQFWSFVAVFCLSSPIGCLIGMLSASVGPAVSRSVTSGICVSIASGTFLQVSTMELLPQTLTDPRFRTTACVGFTVGFSSMSLLALWV